MLDGISASGLNAYTSGIGANPAQGPVNQPAPQNADKDVLNEYQYSDTNASVQVTISDEAIELSKSAQEGRGVAQEGEEESGAPEVSNAVDTACSNFCSSTFSESLCF